MGAITAEQMLEVIKNFTFEGEYKSYEPWGNGHINDTFLVVFTDEAGNDVRYILQRMNTSIFTKPVELMENILGVTSYLREIIKKNGGN